MPGVNLPMSQIGYYLLTLFVCGVFHEMGHAIAAVRQADSVFSSCKVGLQMNRNQVKKQM
jgi:hypothetical protein